MHTRRHRPIGPLAAATRRAAAALALAAAVVLPVAGCGADESAEQEITEVEDPEVPVDPPALEEETDE